MAADDDVNVKVGATSDVTAGLDDAVSSLKNAVSSMTDQLKALSSASAETTSDIRRNNKEIEGAFTALQAKIAAFQGQVEGSLGKLTAPFVRLNAGVAAFLGVLAGGAAFEHWIEQSNDFQLSALKLAQTFGIDSDQATTFAVALHSVGLSNEQAEASFRKFELQLRRNSDGLKKLGVDIDGIKKGTKTSMDGFLEAIQIVGKYKEGNDQLQVAMQLLGTRSMTDLQAFLRLTTERMKEAEEEQRSLGLTVTEESIAMARAYKENMAGVNTVVEAIGKVIAEAVMPSLIRLAQWFREEGPTAVNIMRGVMETWNVVMGSIGEIVMAVWDILKSAFTAIGELIQVVFGREAPDAMQFFKNVLAVVQIAAIALKTGFLEVLESIKDGIDVAQVWIMRFGATAKQIFEHPFDIGAAVDVWNSYGKRIEDLTKQHYINLAKISADGAAAMAAAAAKAYAPPEETKGTPRPAKGGLSAPDFSKQKSERDTRMAEWREELDKRIEMEVGYFNDSKALEIRFWEEKLAIAQAALAKDNDQKSKAYQQDLALVRQIEKILFSEHKSAANKQLQEDIKVLEDEMAENKHNIDAQIALAKQIFDIKSIYYSQDVAKVADANKKIIELERQKADMIKKAQEEINSYRLESSLLAIQNERNELNFAVEMGKVSADQRFAIEVDLANKEYALTVQSIRDNEAARLEGLEVGSAEYLKVELDINKQILDATRKNEAEIVKIKQEAIKEATRYEMEAVKAVQDSTVTLLDELETHTKSMKTIALDWVNSLTAALNKLVAQNLMEKIMGPGTGVQDMLSKMFGGLFGTAGGANAPGVVAANASLTSLSTMQGKLSVSTAALSAAFDQLAAKTAVTGAPGLSPYALLANAPRPTGAGVAGTGVPGSPDLKPLADDVMKVDKSLQDMSTQTEGINSLFTDFSTVLDKSISSLGQFINMLLSAPSGGGGAGGLFGSIASLFKGGGGASATEAGWTSGFDLAGFAEGTNYVPRDMVAQVHKGEAIIPAKANQRGFGGGVMVSNNFDISGPVDMRTQQQIAAAAAAGTQKAIQRNL